MAYMTYVNEHKLKLDNTRLIESYFLVFTKNNGIKTMIYGLGQYLNFILSISRKYGS